MAAFQPRVMLPGPAPVLCRLPGTVGAAPSAGAPAHGWLLMVQLTGALWAAPVVTPKPTVGALVPGASGAAQLGEVTV